MLHACIHSSAIPQPLKSVDIGHRIMQARQRMLTLHRGQITSIQAKVISCRWRTMQGCIHDKSLEVVGLSSKASTANSCKQENFVHSFAPSGGGDVAHV